MADTIRRDLPTGGMKEYGGFLLDMKLMNLSAPKLPELNWELPDASKDYNHIFQLNPDVTYSQGFTDAMSSYGGWRYGMFGESSSSYMQMGSFGGMRNYNPSYYNDYTESNQASEPPLHIKEGEIMDRYNHREYEEDHFSQAGDLYRLMSAEQKEILCQNIKEAMEGVPVEIKKRQIEHFKKADANYGKRVEELVL